MRLVLCTLFLTSFASCGNDPIREPHSLVYDSTLFNSLAGKILSQKSIFEMDDLTRYFKKINEINVRYSNGNEPGDTLCSDLYAVLDSMNIDKALVFELKSGLEKTTLREFYKSNDSILFRVDGFLSSSWGFFYSKRPLTNSSSFFFKGYSIEYVGDLDSNWKKVAIRP